MALGDSYAAGIGAGRQRGEMERTDAGYPLRVAGALGMDLTYQAVLGATVEDVARDQVPALGDATELVTVTVGGNDVGFVPVLLEVVQPAWVSDSDAAIDGALDLIRGDLPGRLTRLLEDVGQSAPNAQLVVTGYPHLFNGVSDCSLLTFVTRHEMDWLARAADELVMAIEAVTEDVGGLFVDVREGFDGHQVCDDEEWINGLAWPLHDSYHPNAAGHDSYGDIVLSGLREERREVPAPQVAEGRARGTAPRFGLPSLMTRRSLQGAAARGLDPAAVAELGRRAEDPGRSRGEREDAARHLQDLHEQVCRG